jgi:hypothetical protein
MSTYVFQKMLIYAVFGIYVVILDLFVTLSAIVLCGVFRCYRKIAKSDYSLRHVHPCVHLSVCLQRTTRFPLEGFS